MDLLSQIIEIFLLGIIAGAIPGPILTSVFTEILSGGWGKGFKVVLRALAAESIVAIVILVILSFLNVPQLYFEILSLFGGAYMAYLAIGVWKINKIGDEKGEFFTFSKILILTVLNGGFWIFWLTVCVPMAFTLGRQIIYGQASFLIAFEAGWLTATMFLALVFSSFRPLLMRKHFVPYVFKSFALLLTFFGIRIAWTSVVYLARYL